MKYIEVTSLSKITSFNDGVMSSRLEKETELINVDNIALVTNSGDIYLKRGYPNGENVCKTDHTYEEIKAKIDQSFLDECAMRAMQGFISKYGNDGPYDSLAEMPYQVAKVMLKTRKELQK